MNGMFLNWKFAFKYNSQTWTGAPSVPSALVSMLLRLPKVKFVIVTLGGSGCIMVERHAAGV